MKNRCYLVNNKLKTNDLILIKSTKSRRHFLKVLACLSAALAIPQFALASENDLVEKIKEQHSALGGYLLGETSAWLTVACAAAGFDRVSKIKSMYKEVEFHGVQGAMAVTAISGSNFNRQVFDWYKQHHHQGKIVAWMTMARALNQDRDDSLNALVERYKGDGDSVGVVAFAYALSGFQAETLRTYDFLNLTSSYRMESAWKVLAYVVFRALNDPERKREIDGIYKQYAAKGEAGSIVTLAYVASGLKRSELNAIAREFGFISNGGSYDNDTALLVLAYAIALNPNNGLFSRGC